MFFIILFVVFCFIIALMLHILRALAIGLAKFIRWQSARSQFTRTNNRYPNIKSYEQANATYRRIANYKPDPNYQIITHLEGPVNPDGEESFNLDPNYYSGPTLGWDPPRREY